MASNDPDISFILGRLEGKVDSLLNISKVQQHTLTEHDERLRALEHYKSYAIGVTIAVGAIVSYLTQFLT
jgi:hypothetical protein